MCVSLGGTETNSTEIVVFEVDVVKIVDLISEERGQFEKYIVTVVY